MEITRNQYYIAGLVLFLLGLQFRFIESVELTEHFARFIAERTDHPLINVSAQSPVLAPMANAAINRMVSPPEWIGWLLVSVGGILVAHALAMPKASG